MDTSRPQILESHPSIPLLYRTLSFNTSISITGGTIEPRCDRIPELDLYVDDMCRRLQTDKTRGLTSEQAQDRRLQYGANVIRPPRTNYFKKLCVYVFGGFNFVIWIAAILMFISWKPLSGDQATTLHLGVGILLLLVIAISSFFYALVDYRASRKMTSIRSLVANTACVRRDDEIQIMDAEGLVRGDLVYLQAGQRVPADLRLIDVSPDALFDRSIMTGESKLMTAGVQSSSRNPLESKNMAMSSTFLARGAVRGVVIRIGNDTVIGTILRISVVSITRPPKTPIQKDVTTFTVVISIIALIFFTFAMSLWAGYIQFHYPRYETVPEAVVDAISALLAIIPIGLPICFALLLTTTARQMAEGNVLVKNLNMIDTLGCISVLCSDKTGTLTIGKMAVHSTMFIDLSIPLQQGTTPDLLGAGAMSDLLNVARICNDARFEANTDHIPFPERPVKGDATDSAIFRYSEMIGPLVPAIPRFQILFSLPFASKNKFMGKIVRWEGGRVTLLAKGAPDILTRTSSQVMQSDGTIVDFDVGRRQDMEGIEDTASRKGHRVIAICQKELDADTIPSDDEALEAYVHSEMKQDLTLIGLLALSDPPRQDVPDAVHRMRRAGIRVFMVTGDFEITACSIARSVGIMSVAENEIKRVIDLETLKDKDPLGANMDPCDLYPRPGSPPRAIVINGTEVEALLDNDWDYIAAKCNEMVFARTTPEQKLLIVKNLKKRGDNIVAVTGDGTNDAPALKAANVGVCMGSGTDIAKEAATMILITNTFPALMVAIENGRLAFDNLRKVILLLMTNGSYAQFIAVASGKLFGMQIPLSLFQQIVFNLTIDVILAIALMYETPEGDLMDRPPRNARIDRLTDWKFALQLLVIMGPMVWIGSMGMWFLYMSTQGLGFYDLMFAFNRWGPEWQGKTLEELRRTVITGQCIYFVTMAICQIGVLFAVRNRKESILKSNPLWGPRQNLFILFAIACNIAICVIIFYGYWIQVIFSTSPIPLNYWFIPFGFVMAIVLLDEIRKYFVRNYKRSFVAKIAW